jgi:hypothetical protein
MGIQDFSCFICSCEGDQTTPDWMSSETNFIDRKGEPCSNNGLCYYPAQPVVGEGYLPIIQGSRYEYKNNPLNDLSAFVGKYPMKFSGDGDIPDGFDDETYIHHSELSSDISGCGKSVINSIWFNPETKLWYLNICNSCEHYFFIEKDERENEKDEKEIIHYVDTEDAEDNPPPELLVRIATKFELIPTEE